MKDARTRARARHSAPCATPEHTRSPQGAHTIAHTHDVFACAPANKNALNYQPQRPRPAPAACTAGAAMPQG
eukprot:scaffold69941_cov57-Phaeocystis_antarctica.AAC.1